MAQVTTPRTTLVRYHEHHSGIGVVSGLTGGLVFGLIMQGFGMMPAVASLVRSESVAVGWLIHLIISAIAGLTFAWWFGTQTHSLSQGLGYGSLLGLIWWIIGPLIIMPLWLGMNLQFANMFSQDLLLSLAGHLVYGIVTGITFATIAKSPQA